MTTPSFWLYRTSTPAPGLFDHFLGGLFLVKGFPIFLQLAVITFVSIALGLLLFSNEGKTKKQQTMALNASKFCSYLAFFFLCLLLFSPWDETFINLRHSLNFAKRDMFSFNFAHPPASEGTVDFLVFWVLGWLGKWQLPLVELLFFQSLLGGILCVLALESLAKSLHIRAAERWGTFVFTTFPTLLLNSSCGFANGLFVAAILWCLYFTFFKRRPLVSFILLAIIPLIRWEGFAFSLLCFGIQAIDLRAFSSKQRNRFLIGGLLSSLPFLLLSLYRFKTFHSWIPVPVIYKSSIGNLFYLMMGIRNFFLDLISTLCFPFLLTIGLAHLFFRSEFNKLTPVQRPLGILILFVFPYYLSGGDWFPSAWGRYFLPFTLFVLPVGWKLLSDAPSPFKKRLLVTFGFSLVLCLSVPTSALIRIYQTCFNHGSALLSLNLKKRFENPLYRAHYLSQLGLLLKQTTDPQDRIGSSELATLMYFSDRDAVDFLGLVDLNLARYPLRETPTFFRTNPKMPELPLLIFKRVAPERLQETKPEFLYLFDMMMEMLVDQRSTEGWKEDDYRKLYSRWEIKFRGLINPLYGGLERLIQIGYTPIVIEADKDFCALYFVRNDKFSQHQAKLISLGFQGQYLIP